MNKNPKKLQIGKNIIDYFECYLVWITFNAFNSLSKVMPTLKYSFVKNEDYFRFNLQASICSCSTGLFLKSYRKAEMIDYCCKSVCS